MKFWSICLFLLLLVPSCRVQLSRHLGRTRLQHLSNCATCATCPTVQKHCTLHEREIVEESTLPHSCIFIRRQHLRQCCEVWTSPYIQTPSDRQPHNFLVKSYSRITLVHRNFEQMKIKFESARYCKIKWMEMAHVNTVPKGTLASSKPSSS